MRTENTGFYLKPGRVSKNPPSGRRASGRGESLDLFKNPVGSRTSLPKNADFLMKSTFFVVFKRNLFENRGFRTTLLKKPMNGIDAAGRNRRRRMRLPAGPAFTGEEGRYIRNTSICRAGRWRYIRTASICQAGPIIRIAYIGRMGEIYTQYVYMRWGGDIYELRIYTGAGAIYTNCVYIPGRARGGQMRRCKSPRPMPGAALLLYSRQLACIVP
jgi:hypothetical protein